MYLRRWCQYFFKQRTAALQINGQSHITDTSVGVPQGSPLSSLLFILGVNAALQIPCITSEKDGSTGDLKETESIGVHRTELQGEVPTKRAAEQLMTQDRSRPEKATYTDLGWCKRHISFLLNCQAHDQQATADKGRAVLDLHPPTGKGHFPSRRLQRINASRINQFLANHFPSKW